MSKKIRLIILLLLLLVVAGTGYRMYQLNAAHRLWGHLPLYFLVAVWTLFVLLRKKSGTGWKWLGLSTLSGVLLALAFPPFPLTFLLFVAFVPLLLVEDEISRKEEKSLRKIWWYSYHSFVVWNILATWWVANSALAAGMIANFLNAFFMTIPFVGFHLVKKWSPKFGYLSLVSFWLSFEYIHLNWEISWTWLNLGNAFAEFPTWIQWYEYTGVFGGGLWVLSVNILFFLLVKKRLEKGSLPKWGIIKVTGLVLVPVIVSMVLYFTYEDKGEQMEVALIQPNYEPHYEKFTISRTQQLKRFLTLSEKVVTDSTDYLILPETSFGSVNIKDMENHPAIKAFRSFVGKKPHLTLVAGVSSYKILGIGDPKTPAVRERIRGTDTLFWEAYNGAIQIEKGQPIPHYRKSKLVPGAELLPYRSFFFFLKPLVHKLGGTMAGLGMQKERSVFFNKSGVGVAPVICYESVYGDYLTGYIRHGANMIFVMTNDGWWDKTAGHKQHLQYSVLRAIETRRSIARAANTGISATINQRGDIANKTKYGEEAAINVHVKANDKITFYVKWGDIIGRIALLFSLIIFPAAFVQKRIGE